MNAAGGEMQDRTFAYDEQFGLSAVRQDRRSSLTGDPNGFGFLEHSLPAFGIGGSAKDTEQIAVGEFREIKLFRPTTALLFRSGKQNTAVNQWIGWHWFKNLCAASITNLESAWIPGQAFYLGLSVNSRFSMLHTA